MGGTYIFTVGITEISFTALYFSQPGCHNFGNMAPPAIPTINKAEPVLICRPRPSIVKGHNAGHTGALAKPSKAIKRIDVYPEVKMAPSENITPNIAAIRKAF